MILYYIILYENILCNTLNEFYVLNTSVDPHFPRVSPFDCETHFLLMIYIYIYIF